ncbi:tripartite tricarboxylate transporter TctB family protein [Indioceanicola profundi]|uniref:tripartite tricarboxylate transporter TctB family protein n=1 Tax=Indioceanicola profundi TaxID=2220096 RepID=UPI000E6AA432|nr:tripartite tricarboxylate transporter TctB family protein [Indioceanicola profundi]
MQTEAKRPDYGTIVVSAIFILLGIWVLSQTGEMSPLGSVFPRTIATVMIVCSAVLIVVTLLRGRKLQAAASGSVESTPRRVALIMVMGAWILLMPVLGFFTTSLIAFVALLAVANYDPLPARTMAWYALAAVLTVGAFYLLMTRVLLVPVPKGLLF